MPTPLSVLIVDDSPSDAQLIVHELGRSGFAATAERVETQGEVAAALDRGGFQLIIADYHLPGWSGLGALRMLQERGLSLPFIVVSGTIGEETAVEAMRAGAHDYVLKDNLARLGPAVTREIADAQVRRERHQALAALGDMARKSAFLAEASRKLGASLNYEETLREAARVALPELADWCLCHVPGETHDKVRIIAAHVDSALEEKIRAHLAEYPPERRTDVGPGRVIKSGQPHVTVPDGLIFTAAGRAEDEAIVTALGHESGISLPLVAHGHAIGVITFVRTTRRFGPDDVTFAAEVAQRAATAIDNAMLYRQAREAIRARDEFLLVASHELNTPLATLTLRINEVLETDTPQGAKPKPQSPGLSAARRQVQNLARMVGNLLDVSRITAHRLVLSVGEMDMVATFRDLIEQLGPELTRAKCPIHLSAPEALYGRWDALRINQIGTNLITNALKYGSGQPIEVKIEQTQGKARITVSDRGIGIASEDANRIFELFERSGAAKDFGGLGLGLYITRQVVEAHGGTIRVSSKPREGASFVVELPLVTEVLENQPRRGLLTTSS